MCRRPWIVAFMSYVSLLGTEKDLDAVYWLADSLYPDSRLLDPAEAASSQFGPLLETFDPVQTASLKSRR